MLVDSVTIDTRRTGKWTRRYRPQSHVVMFAVGDDWYDYATFDDYDDAELAMLTLPVPE